MPETSEKYVITWCPSPGWGDGSEYWISVSSPAGTPDDPMAYMLILQALDQESRDIQETIRNVLRIREMEQDPKLALLYLRSKSDCVRYIARAIVRGEQFGILYKDMPKEVGL